MVLISLGSNISRSFSNTPRSITLEYPTHPTVLGLGLGLRLGLGLGIRVRVRIRVRD